MTPALVIFDMAGTTVEDRGQVPTAFAETLAANNITITADEIARVRGASKRQAIRTLLAPADAGHADRIYREFSAKLSTAYAKGGVHLVPGAADLIRNLRASGIKVALTTGFDREIVDLLLSKLGWTGDTIDAVVCGDDVSSGRPAPDMILLAMKLTGVNDPAQVANVGDTTMDLESAARAGVGWNIGVLSGAHARDTLARAPHTHILPSVADVEEVLRS